MGLPLLTVLSMFPGIISNIPFAEAQQANSNFLTYTSTDLGFTIKYPSDWTVNEDRIVEGSVSFISPDRGGFLVVSLINLKPNETNMSPEGLLKNFTSHQPVGFRPIEVNTNN
jgi:hypothetical protein